MTRRDALTRTVLACSAPIANGLAWGAGSDFIARVAGIEKRNGGRLGVAVWDPGGSRNIGFRGLGHRSTERFPMCSTFKASAVALVLQRVDRHEEKLDRRIVFAEQAILSYAPVTKLHVGGDGMTVADLCAAAITVSDNTAANLLLASFGGPPALTKFWRSIGDSVTRLDRTEPDLNEGTPGDPRDTTSPVAMAKTLSKLAFGDVLSGPSRELFTKWLVASTTGDACLRAGLPRGWVIGDKTGSGAHETRNDIAVIWPKDRKPLVVAAYLTQGPSTDEARNGILAEVGRVVADEIMAQEQKSGQKQGSASIL